MRLLRGVGPRDVSAAALRIVGEARSRSRSSSRAQVRGLLPFSRARHGKRSPGRPGFLCRASYESGGLSEARGPEYEASPGPPPAQRLAVLRVSVSCLARIAV